MRSLHTFQHKAHGIISYSLLLAASPSLFLTLAGDDLAKHHHTIAIHEGHTRKTLTIIEGVTHQRLLRLKGALRHLIRLQGVWIIHLLATSLLAHLPLQLRDTASRAAAAHETDGRIANLDLVRDVE